MKVVILAAGKGSRMLGLTKEVPKPLLKIKGKTLLEYKFDILPKDCNEIILVIGYLGEKIKKYFGNEYKGKKITYIQSDPLGTGYSLWQARDHLNEKFIVMTGDDLYSSSDLQECLKHDLSGLVYKLDKAQSGGKVVTKGDFITDIVEGSNDVGSTIATGLYVLNPKIFNLKLVPIKNGEEFGLPQTIIQSKKPIKAVYATNWHQVTSPEDLDLPEDMLNLFRLID